MSNYSTMKYLDENLIKDTVKSNIIKILELKDIFIINNGDVIYVDNDPGKLIKYLTKGEDIYNWKMYKILDFLEFTNTFIKPTNKYKTYNKMTIYKYHNTIKLGNKRDKFFIGELSKNKKVQLFFREHKLKRILKNED